MPTYDANEVYAFRQIFDAYDDELAGKIPMAHIPDMLEKVCLEATEGIKYAINSVCDEQGLVVFEDLLDVLQAEGCNLESLMRNKLYAAPTKIDVSHEATSAELDHKVSDFIAILEEYRAKCESEGNYPEAQRADSQLQTLRKQEVRRQTKALRASQIAERQDIQIAHTTQFEDFNHAWDQYLNEYDRVAENYLNEINEKHRKELIELQENLQRGLVERPPKFSKELIDWRRRQHLLAQQKNYAEAQKIKQTADCMEQQERLKFGSESHKHFARKEAKLRQQQQAEVHALLKRVDMRRKEHLNQRSLDSKRLLQRNRNVQAVLESKQIVEATKRLQDIKSGLVPRERSALLGKNATSPHGGRSVSVRKSQVIVQTSA